MTIPAEIAIRLGRGDTDAVLEHLEIRGWNWSARNIGTGLVRVYAEAAIERENGRAVMETGATLLEALEAVARSIWDPAQEGAA